MYRFVVSLMYQNWFTKLWDHALRLWRLNTGITYLHTLHTVTMYKICSHFCIWKVFSVNNWRRVPFCSILRIENIFKNVSGLSFLRQRCSTSHTNIIIYTNHYILPYTIPHYSNPGKPKTIQAVLFFLSNIFIRYKTVVHTYIFIKSVMIIALPWSFKVRPLVHALFFRNAYFFRRLRSCPSSSVSACEAPEL